MEEILRAVAKSEAETQKFAEIFAKELLRFKSKQAIVVGLEGELGSGKTVFAKGFAKGLGIKEEMKSPTFILMRVFKIKKRNFFHIDAWRAELDFREFLKNPKNILLIEWSDKVRNILPERYFRLVFRSPTSLGSRTSREITLYA